MYPPQPPFLPLRDSERPRVLGEIKYARDGGDAIRITNGWHEQHLVTVHIPQLAHLPATSNGHIRFHKVAAGQLAALFAAWDAAGLIDRILTWDGAWVARTIRGNRAVLSNHAYGTAFDLNARWNPWRGRAAPAGQVGSVVDLVPLANAHGFYWGGHWNYDGRGASDGMHFEWAIPL